MLTAVALAVLPAGELESEAQAPQGWTQFQGGAEHSGAAEGPLPPYRREWASPIEVVGQRGAWAPVIAPEEGIVITVAARSVHGVDVQNGDEVWTAERASGPPTAPALVSLDDGPAVVLTEGNNGETSNLVALNATDGRRVWGAPVDLRAASGTGVTVFEDRAFVGDDLGNVYAVDVEKGSEAWSVELPGPVTNTITVTENVVIALIANRDRRAPEVIALDPATGEELWTARPEVAAAGSIGVIVDDTIVIGFGDRRVRAFALDDGSQRWQSELLFGSPSPATAAATADGDVVIAGQLGDIWRLDGVTGERVWDFALNREILASAPVIVSSSTVVVGTSDGTLAGIDLDSGELVFRGPPLGRTIGPLAITPDVLVGPTGGEGGGLVAFGSDPNGELIRETSPSLPDWASLLGTYALAALSVVVVLVVGFRTLAARVDPTFPEGDDEPDATDSEHGEDEASDETEGDRW